MQKNDGRIKKKNIGSLFYYHLGKMVIIWIKVFPKMIQYYNNIICADLSPSFFGNNGKLYVNI